MKPSFLLILLAAVSLAHADPHTEKSINELEASSAAFRIDAINHINSIRDKYQALPKGAYGLSNNDAFFQTVKTIQKVTYALLANGRDLRSSALGVMENGRKDEDWFFDFTHSKVSPSARLNMVMRELNCADFALGLMVEFDSPYNESLSLANTVLRDCKKINDAQMGLPVATSSPTIPVCAPAAKSGKKK